MAIIGKEKRLFPRVNLKTPLRLQIRGTPEYKNVLTDNVSAGGMSFLNSHFMPPGTSVALEFNLLSQAIRPYAKIKRSESIPHSDRYRIGLEFSEINAREKRYISDYVDLKRSGLAQFL